MKRSPRSASRLLAGLLLLGSGACRDEASPRTAGSGPSTPAASMAPRPPDPQPYQPPKDGRVTQRQLDQYVAVRDRIRIALRQAPPPGARKNELDTAALESRAAAEAAVPLEEYLWVREKILEADAAAAAVKQNADLIAMLEKTVGELKDRKAKASDEGSLKLIAEQLSSFEDELGRIRREAREREPEAVRANLRLLEGSRGRIAPLQDEIDRLRAERVTPRPSPAAAP